jgi:ribosomal protein L35AE/L33A
MTEKEKLFEDLMKKSGKSEEELNSMIQDKINELSGLVSEEGAIYIIANDLGIRLEVEKLKKENKLIKIEDIKEPNQSVTFAGKVIRKYDLINFTSSKGNQGSVQSILLKDETGIIRVTFWNELTEKLNEVKVGDVLKIINAYTRENTQFPGRIDVHFGQYSDLEINPEGLEIDVEVNDYNIEAQDKKISDLEENDKNIILSGVITDFDIPRFYNACPECFKKVFQEEDKFLCPIHEEVEPLQIPIINVKIDDSSGIISIVGFRDRAEKLTKLESKEILDLTEDIEKYRDFSKKLIGKSIKVLGNVSISTLTGEKQFLITEVLEIEDFERENQDNNIVNKEENNANTEIKEDDLSIDDLEMEEINFDDDI